MLKITLTECDCVAGQYCWGDWMRLFLRTLVSDSSHRIYTARHPPYCLFSAEVSAEGTVIVTFTSPVA